MRTSVARSFALVVVLVVSLAAAACDSVGPVAPVEEAAASRGLADLEVGIKISPATLVLDSDGECVTVHADIAYADVDASTVALSGMAPYSTFADNRGELVAKFEREVVVAAVEPPSATLTLTGLTADGEAFQGSDTITVR